MYLSAEKLKSGALLAPMAGVADRSMRELCMEFGAIAVSYTHLTLPTILLV